MNISGTWEGQYTYGEDYLELADASVRFTMTLEQHGLMRLLGRPRLRGQVRDNAADGGQQGVGRIAGRRFGQTVQFVKSMPPSVMPDEWVDFLRHEFRDQFQSELPRELPDHRIAYQGRIDDDGERITGSWFILPMIFTTDIGEVSHNASGEGTWTARRSSPMPIELR